ncbi:Uncharacterised protein [BD1-7 clade bacterium]|uniref:Uncharacterized protein n=1 Tax=BD1-7 clade bacterium TaxID=2029982 RepID=A0A5S9Q021_9GAMM|nr:Uncharacterised protein [BD1-7 clade bacterium]
MWTYGESKNLFFETYQDMGVEPENVLFQYIFTWSIV